MSEEYNDEERGGGNNHAVVMQGGIVLVCGEIKRLNKTFVRLKPVDVTKSRNFQTTAKLRALVKHHTVFFATVEGDTLDVRGSLIVMIEDSSD